MHGSGVLVRWLLDDDLVDEKTCSIVPVILGQGARLFPDAGRDLALDLVDSRADSKGVVIQARLPADTTGGTNAISSLPSLQNYIANGH